MKTIDIILYAGIILAMLASAAMAANNLDTGYDWQANQAEQQRDFDQQQRDFDRRLEENQRQFEREQDQNRMLQLEQRQRDLEARVPHQRAPIAAVPVAPLQPWFKDGKCPVAGVARC